MEHQAVVSPELIKQLSYQSPSHAFAAQMLRLFILAALAFITLPFILPLAAGISNFISWQSFLLFFVSAIMGLRVKYTLISKCNTIFLGITQSYVLTHLHLFPVLTVPIRSEPALGLVFHEYITILFTFVWLALFWKFATRFILKKNLW